MADYRLVTPSGARYIVGGGGIIQSTTSSPTWQGLQWCQCPGMIINQVVQATMSDVSLCCMASEYAANIQPVRGPNGFPLCIGYRECDGPCILTSNGLGVDSCGVYGFGLYENCPAYSTGGGDSACSYPPCILNGEWSSPYNSDLLAWSGFYYGFVLINLDGTYQVSIYWVAQLRNSGAMFESDTYLIFYNPSFIWAATSDVTVDNTLSVSQCGDAVTVAPVGTGPSGIGIPDTGGGGPGTGSATIGGYGGSVTLSPRCSSADCGTVAPCTTLTCTTDCGPPPPTCSDTLPSSVTLDVSGIACTGPEETCLDGQSVTACTNPLVLTASGTTYSSAQWGGSPPGCSNGTSLVEAQVVQSGTDPCSWTLTIHCWCWFEFGNTWVAGTNWSGSYTGPTPQGTYVGSDGTSYTVE